MCLARLAQTLAYLSAPTAWSALYFSARSIAHVSFSTAWQSVLGGIFVLPIWGETREHELHGCYTKITKTVHPRKTTSVHDIHAPKQIWYDCCVSECSRVAYAELHRRQRELVVRPQVAVNVDERPRADRDRRRPRIVIVWRAPNVQMAQKKRV